MLLLQLSNLQLSPLTIKTCQIYNFKSTKRPKILEASNLRLINLIIYYLWKFNEF